MLLVVLCSIGCRSPEKVYDTIKREVDRGEFDSTLTQADAALRHYGARNKEWEWRFRLLKARILVSRSQGDEALSLLEPEPPSALASTEIPEQRKRFQGIAHRYKQQFGDAERDFEEAERLAAPLAPRYPCQLLIDRAALWVDEKKYDSAQADYRKALVLAKRNSLPILEASALADLARLTTSQNHYDEALDLYLAALKLAQSLDMKGNTATILGNMGWSYFELGDFEASLDFYRQGAQASVISGMKGYSAYWFSGVADSHLALHQYTLAEDLAQDTLKRARELKDAETTTICLNTLADVLLRKGQLADAERYNRDALKMEEAGLDKLATPGSLLLAGRIATSRKRFSEATELFHRVLAEPTTEMPLQWEAEAGLANVLDNQARFAEADRQYQKALDTIETARRSINHDELRLSFLSSGIAVYGEYIDFLVRHGRPADALKLAELGRARTLAEGLAATNRGISPSLYRFPPQQIAHKLKASLLFYWIGEKNSYLWVITPAKTSYFKLPPASQIDPVVADYRKAVLHMRDAQDDGSAEGKNLYAMLVEPARKLIPPGSQVIVLPSESLYGLNFETLIVPDPQPHFWIEDVTLTTGSSLTMLAASADRPTPKDRTLFLVGDTRPPNPPFVPLPQAAEEMKQVRKYFPGAQARVLEGGSATPTAFLKSNPEQFSYLHFVTHGTASHTRPLESAVILSQEGDSYKLYARDIVQHRLNANLVTISACNGAGTRAYSGEGLVGLSWAFLRAGAHNVIGALWEVSDASTPQLMDAFYREIFQGKDPATALRNAKLTLLHSPDPESVFKKPFYWAPFQLYAGS